MRLSASEIGRASVLTVKWALWAEVLGPVVVIALIVPAFPLLEPARESNSLAAIVAGAIMFSGWGTMMFFLRIPSLILSAMILGGVSRQMPAIESSALMSSCIVALIGLATAEVGFLFVSDGARGDVPRISWILWILPYLLVPRLIVPSIKPGAFGRMWRARDGPTTSPIA
jgi:hypothetical protein